MKKYILKQKRSRSKKNILENNFLGFFFLTLVLFFGALYLVVFYSFFQIKSVVTAKEEDTVNSQQFLIKEVEKQALNNFLFLPTKSIFLFKKEEVAEMIKEKEPTAKDVFIKKIFPSSLEIEIKTRKTKALWCKEKDCFCVDEEGTVFKESENKEGVIFYKQGEVVLGEKITTKSDLDLLFYLEEKISDLDFSVESFNFINLNTVQVFLEKEDWSIYFSKENTEKEFKNLEVAIEKITKEELQELDYIDLRFESKVFYK
jgi:hypothetical protein